MEQDKKFDFSGLNHAQSEAVRCSDGPSLIIAGAGSGKTRVLTYKIAHLIYEGIKPGSILALTFTNKASKEMKERIASMVGPELSSRLWMGTFHSIFIRILRKYAEQIGFSPTFTIYDTSDTRSAVRQCIKELQLDDKVYKPQEVASRISFAKNNLVTAAAYKNNPTAVANDRQAHKGQICDIYELYARKCRVSGAMDFDDILLFMNILLRDYPSVVEELSSRFSHILVDEYQDTNLAQYYIIRKLSALKRNITVVGDDSQSIYGFRGARIQNILNFRKDFPEAREFRLEQNYRSTRTIVDAANSVIAKNTARLPKKCFSEGPQGDKIEVLPSFTEMDEAQNVVNSIAGRIRTCGASYDSFAVLYRTNAQSRTIEEALRRRNLPYRIFAGHSFYERQEIKDVLSYFRLVTNHNDDESLKRIINFPARAIGDTTLGRLFDAARVSGTSLWDTIWSDSLAEYGIREAVQKKMRDFCNLIASFRGKALSEDAYSTAVEIVNLSGVLQSLKSDTSINGQSRLSNVEELLNSIDEFVEGQTEAAVESGAENPVITLADYLENIALMTDYEAADKDKKDDRNRIALMTVHSAKGLEFPYVYIVGMEEKMFPSSMCIESENDIEEERRLFYVALTRAEKCASVSFARSRMKWGERVTNPPSRFLREIDQKYLSQPISKAAGYGSDVEDETDGDDWRSGFFRHSPAARTMSGPASRPAAGPNYRSSSRPVSSHPSGQGRPAREQVVLPPQFSRADHKASADFRPDDPSKMAVGQRVEHDRFGYGVITSVEGSEAGHKVIVDFEVGGIKTLLTKYAKIRIIG